MSSKNQTVFNQELQDKINVLLNNRPSESKHILLEDKVSQDEPKYTPITEIKQLQSLTKCVEDYIRVDIGYFSDGSDHCDRVTIQVPDKDILELSRRYCAYLEVNTYIPTMSICITGIVYYTKLWILYRLEIIKIDEGDNELGNVTSKIYNDIGKRESRRILRDRYLFDDEIVELRKSLVSNVSTYVYDDKWIYTCSIDNPCNESSVSYVYVYTKGESDIKMYPKVWVKEVGVDEVNT